MSSRGSRRCCRGSGRTYRFWSSKAAAGPVGGKRPASILRGCRTSRQGRRPSTRGRSTRRPRCSSCHPCGTSRLVLSRRKRCSTVFLCLPATAGRCRRRSATRAFCSIFRHTTRRRPAACPPRRKLSRGWRRSFAFGTTRRNTSDAATTVASGRGAHPDQLAPLYRDFFSRITSQSAQRAPRDGAVCLAKLCSE